MNTETLNHLRKNQNLYVLQDASQTVGNDLLFWRKGKTGYTTDLAQAHLFTLKEANLQNHDRATDVPHRLGDLLDRMNLSVTQESLAAQRPQPQPTTIPDDSPLLQRHTRALLDAIETMAPDFKQDILVVTNQDTPYDLLSVTIDPDDWFVQQQEDQDLLTRKLSPLEFAGNLWRYNNLDKAMQYGEWTLIALIAREALKRDPLTPTADRNNVIDPTYGDVAKLHTPADLPPALAEGRMNALITPFPRPDFLQTKLELTELLIASRHGRTVNTQLFDRQPKPNWRALTADNDLGDLMELGYTLQNDADSQRRLIEGIEASDSPTVPEHERLYLALLEQEADECAYMIELEYEKDLHLPVQMPSEPAQTDSPLVADAKRLLADLRSSAPHPEQPTPTVWAYEQDGSMNAPIVTINRWSNVPEGWNESDLTELLATDKHQPTAEKLHQWANGFNKVIGQMQSSDDANLMANFAQQMEQAALYAQANELLEQTGHPTLTSRDDQTADLGTPTATIPTSIIQEALQETLDEADTGGHPVLVVSNGHHPDLIEAVIIDPAPWQEQRYRNEGGLVCSRMALSEFAATLWQYPNLHESMGYGTWTKLAEFVQPHMSEVFLDDPTASGLEATTPTDLPPVIAQNRLALLDTFAKPENLQAKIELTEVIMANLNGEPVNRSIFSEASLSKPDWHTLTANRDIGEFVEASQTLANKIEQTTLNLNAQRDLGHPPTQDDRFELAALKMEQAELDHLVEMGALHLERQKRQATPDADELDDNLDSDCRPG